jgi:cytochrome c biogenesis protein
MTCAISSRPTPLHADDTVLTTTEAPNDARESEATRLSTAPLARSGWRHLTSMRTALLLLTLLALAAIPGTVLPQRGLNPVKVDTFLANHPHLGPFLDHLSLFDVFAAPWFAAIYLLLFISLVGCLVPRIRLHARALRKAPPATPRHLDRLSVNEAWSSGVSADEVVAGAADTLRRHRWRTEVRTEPSGTVSVAAEKGYLRESGNLVFHVSLVVLLAGIALGGLFGYKGTVLVVQGQGFANVRSSYDIFEPSRLYSDKQLAPFSFMLKQFKASYEPSGQPRSFDALVDYQAQPGAATSSHDVRVNHPLAAAGANVYLIGHGYALHIQVRSPRGRLVYDSDTPFLPDDEMFASHGVVKVPTGLPHQLGLTGFFYPTFEATPLGPRSSFPAARNPVLSLAAWRGDLGLDSGVPQSVYELPVASLRLLDKHELSPGQSWRLADGTTIRFSGVDQWATFQVAHDPGKRVVLVAAILVIVGLLGSLRVRRRRFWLRATPVNDDDSARRSVVTAAGLPRTDPDGFRQEFDSLVQRMKD